MTRKLPRLLVVIVAVLSFVVGFVGSGFAVIYYNIPVSGTIPATQTFHKLAIASDLDVNTITSQDLSIHFLELGNKYTGDCTLIKAGDTEVLIDAGSKVNSIPAIKAYLDQYITDNTLEFVIATHAHEDHIAGFGTSENKKSLLDMYNVGTLIQFVYTNNTKKSKPSTVYKNYCREVAEAESRGTKVYNALQCINQSQGAQKVYPLSADINLEILDQKYYHENTAKSENDYSVCCQVVQNNEKYYLFTGDLEAGGEASLVSKNTLHPVELYKAGHHGSKTSSSPALMSVIQPKRICVCCCAGSSEYTKTNVNQFPTQTFINNVAPYTDQIYVTTLCVDWAAGNFESMNGNIVVYCKKDTEVTIACSASNKTILKDTDWFRANRTMPAAWVKN